MRALGVVVAVLLAGGIVLVLVLARTAGDPRGARASAPTSTAPAIDPASDAGPDQAARFAALERRLDELALDVTSLRDELARVRETRQTPPDVESERAPASSDAPPPAEPTPAWYLAQYVASFAGGGQGSEYFRLAVEAFAPNLLREIGALVLDARANVLLRQRLVVMLGDARLRGNAAALEPCLRVLSVRGADALVAAALVALQGAGDATTARALEGVYASIELAQNRQRALQVMVALAGPDANAALGRVWARAADDGERAFLLGLLRTNEGEDALALFDQASVASQPVRLQAAVAIGRFRFPAYVPFIAAWRAREPDERVRAALGAAEKQRDEPRDWSAARAVGPPDARASEDDPNAWASAQGDMGEQWLELGYDPPLRASAVRVFEVCVAGALTSIVAVDERGTRHELWRGDDPTTVPGVFEVRFTLTNFRVRTLRLTLDTNRRPGWSEIDAVELVGPDGRAWASSASASSSYGR